MSDMAYEGHPCPKCGSNMDWLDCEVYGEDTCCCADPEDSVVCDICDGEGGWYVCYPCAANKTERAK